MSDATKYLRHVGRTAHIGRRNPPQLYGLGSVPVEPGQIESDKEKRMPELNDTQMAIKGYQSVIEDAERQIARLRLDERLDGWPVAVATSASPSVVQLASNGAVRKLIRRVAKTVKARLRLSGRCRPRLGLASPRRSGCGGPRFVRPLRPAKWRKDKRAKGPGCQFC